uniref:Uncharacterized protein n=1 Tax=Anopheles arabiensis TaxID=7173 RepID=A0A182IHF5_ANOAR
MSVATALTKSYFALVSYHSSSFGVINRLIYHQYHSDKYRSSSLCNNL